MLIDIHAADSHARDCPLIRRVQYTPRYRQLHCIALHLFDEEVNQGLSVLLFQDYPQLTDVHLLSHPESNAPRS